MDQVAITPAETAPASPLDLMQAGIGAYRDGDFADAARHFGAVLESEPRYPGARINLANALWASGRLAEAAAQADIAHRAEPLSAEAWMITGATRLDRGDAPGAAEAYASAVGCRPELGGAHAGLAAAFLAQSRFAAARESALSALARETGNVHALFSLGSACAALELRDEAMAAFDAVLAAVPDHARARLNRGNMLVEFDRIEEAIVGLRAAVRCDPGLKEAWASLGYTLTVQGDLAGAIVACDRAIALDAEFAIAHWNRGVACLLDGDFAGGFAAYEWRKRHPVYRRHFTRLPAPDWRGEDLKGRHLLVRAEQGFGDTIMLARFLPGLAAQARRLTLACPATLFPLFAHWPIALCPLDRAVPDIDRAVDQMSVPHGLGVTEATIPKACAYLAADPARIAHWNGTLPDRRGMRRVALVWAGNPAHGNDRRRSLPPGALAPLVGLENIQFVGLQFGARGDEYGVMNPSNLIADYGDSAALLATCDAVVSVDTSVAHLAGALGITCHLLLSAACDWRWRLGRTTTPWYDSLILHRQHRLGDWAAPIAAVTEALR